jgi:hypothetical protein
MASSAAVACAMFVGVAQAQISIGSGPAGSVVDLPMLPILPGTFLGVGPNFSVTASDLTGADLGSTTSYLSVIGSGGPIDIWVTETGLGLSPNPVTFTSGFTVNTMPATATVKELTYLDDTDAKYGTGTLLASELFTAPLPAAGGTFVVSKDVTIPYSLTEEYIVDAPAGSSPNILATISLQSVPSGSGPRIPETSTWAMLGIGFGGIALLGMTKRRKGSRYAI